MKQSRVQKKASSVALEANAINGECESFLHHCMVSWKSLKSLSIPSISPMLHNTLDKNSKIKAIYLSWCSLLDTRSFLQRADACAKLRKVDIDLDYPPQDRIDEIDLALLAQAFLRVNPQVVCSRIHSWNEVSPRQPMQCRALVRASFRRPWYGFHTKSVLLSLFDALLSTHWTKETTCELCLSWNRLFVRRCNMV